MEEIRSHNWLNLEGQTFGRLTVLGFAKKEGAFTYWHCVCSCGNTKIVRTNSLRTGRTASCGCLQRETAASRSRLPNNQGVINQYYRNYRQEAGKREIPFELSIDDFMSLIFLPCTYCGVSPSRPAWTQTKSTVLVNGIDRVVNADGYILGNCVPCCKVCNYMKQDLDKEAFLDHIIKIYRRMTSAIHR